MVHAEVPGARGAPGCLQTRGEGSRASIVEGYPVDESGRRVTNAAARTGVLSMFRPAGFEETVRRSRRSPILRLRLP